MNTEPNSSGNVPRRTVLKTGAGSAVGGMLASASLTTAAEKQEANSNVYEVLGIQPIINAAGTITTLGGSLMPPEVVNAWVSASKQFVNLLELQDRVGERIAKLLGVEAALVTTGAAGGIMVGTAAAVTHRDHELVGKLPLPPDAGLQVIRQATHRTCYDNQVKASGVRLVDVKSRDELAAAVSDHTVMMLSYNFQEGDSTISRSDWIAAARKHNIPTLLDAAADTPPLEALSKYNKLGYDMVVFSGGKAIRGPQDAGLLLGRKDLIAAAKLNTAPRCGNIGRGLKVSKEDMVAMWAAVERFVTMDHKAEWQMWEARIAVIEDAVKTRPSVRTERIVPPIANQVPHLLIHWDENRIGITPAQMKQKLAGGDPSIATARIHGTGDAGFLISVFMLQPDEDRIVADRVKSILNAALGE